MTRRAANPGQRPFMVSGDSLKRIAAAVQHYEHGGRRQSPVQFRAAWYDPAPAIRLGSISSDWAKGATKDVQLLDGNGNEIADTTFEAVNRFADITVGNLGSGDSVFVACVLIDATWHLIAAEC